MSGGFFGRGQGLVRSFSTHCSAALVCNHETRDLPTGQCGHDRDVGVFCPMKGRVKD